MEIFKCSKCECFFNFVYSIGSPMFNGAVLYTSCSHVNMLHISLQQNTSRYVHLYILKISTNKMHITWKIWLNITMFYILDLTYVFIKCKICHFFSNKVLGSFIICFGSKTLSHMSEKEALCRYWKEWRQHNITGDLFLNAGRISDSWR